MNECSFSSLNYSNMSPLFMYKCGAGRLIVTENNLSFVFGRAWFHNIEIAKDEVFIKKISSEKIRIFNRKYKFLYLFVDASDKTIGMLKTFGYIDDVDKLQKVTCQSGSHNSKCT